MPITSGEYEEMRLDLMNPGRREAREEAINSCMTARSLSLAFLTSSIAFTVLGIAGGISNNFYSLAIAIPGGFIAYNSIKVIENAIEILENKSAYKSSSIPNKLDGDKLKKKLAENTIASSTVINLAVNLFV